MSTSPRAALLSKTFKVLKKHYKPSAPPSSRSVLEHMLFACCLEGARHDAAEEAFAILQQTYFDWNEVRVTSVAELAEVLSALPDPVAAGRRVRGALQAMFESHYSFDLEFLRKQNLGKSVKELGRHKHVTPFVVSYLVQSGFGGHAVPLSKAALEVLFVLGVISEKERAERRAPGLERAITKKQGVEFGSLLHQLGVDYAASRHSTRVRAILLEIAPDAKERLPKRGGAGKSKKKAKSGAKGKGGKAAEKKSKKSDPRKAAKKTTKKKAAAKKKSGTKKGARKKTKTKGAKKKTKSPTKRLSKKKPR